MLSGISVPQEPWAMKFLSLLNDSMLPNIADISSFSSPTKCRLANAISH